jgi:hypothetical protein
MDYRVSLMLLTLRSENNQHEIEEPSAIYINPLTQFSSIETTPHCRLLFSSDTRKRSNDKDENCSRKIYSFTRFQK